MHFVESRVLGLDTIDRKIQGNHKLAYIQRLLEEKALTKQVQHFEHNAIMQIRLADSCKKKLAEELLNIGIKTAGNRDQRQVIEKFISKFDPQWRLSGDGETTDSATSAENFGQQPPEPTLINGLASNVTHSFSEKRLRTILPRLVERRDQLLNSTLLNEKVPVKKRHRPQPVRPLDTASSYAQGKAVVVCHSSLSGIVDDATATGHFTTLSPVTAVATANLNNSSSLPTGANNRLQQQRHQSPSRKVGEAKVASTRGELQAVTMHRAALFDGIDLGPSDADRERLKRVNMMRMMGGLPLASDGNTAAMITNVSKGNAANWNAAKEKEAAEAAALDRRYNYRKEFIVDGEESNDCPNLRDPLPCRIPTPRPKRKHRERITRTVPLASRMLLDRYRIQTKKIEEHYLSSWKERVLSEDRYRLLDVRRKKLDAAHVQLAVMDSLAKDTQQTSATGSASSSGDSQLESSESTRQRNEEAAAADAEANTQ